MHPFRSFAASRSTDATAILAGALARQAMTPTARAQERLPSRAHGDGRLASTGGAFARAVARSFTGWKNG